MYKRDILLDEIEKFALLLARLMGLKTEGKADEFTQLAENIMLKEYNIPLPELLGLTLKEFEVRLSGENYSADKLDALAQLLYLNSESFTASVETMLSLQKTLFIFDLLEQTHHRQSFENINKRNHIYQFLKNNYEL
jgi:hypothetical protein